MAHTTAGGDDFIELILELQPGADRATAEKLVQSYGLHPTPMRVGLLVADKISALRRFVPVLQGNEPGDVSVDPALAGTIKSIRIVKSRSFQ